MGNHGDGCHGGTGDSPVAGSSHQYSLHVVAQRVNDGSIVPVPTCTGRLVLACKLQFLHFEVAAQDSALKRRARADRPLT